MGILTEQEKAAIRLRWKMNDLSGKMGAAPSGQAERTQAERKAAKMRAAGVLDFTTIYGLMKSDRFNHDAWRTFHRNQSNLRELKARGAISSNDFIREMAAARRAYLTRQHLS